MNFLRRSAIAKGAQPGQNPTEAFFHIAVFDWKTSRRWAGGAMSSGSPAGQLLPMKLLDIYGVTDSTQHQKLMRLAVQSRQPPWWHEYRDLPETAGADLEAQADVIRQYSVLLVPGLLQTEGYAQAVMRAVRGDDSETSGNFERHLKLRMRRQAVLTEQESPEYVVVLDEPVVRRVVGDRQVMREQLQRLTETAALPSVTLHLLPLSVGAHAAMDGEFTLYSYYGGGQGV